MQLLCVSLKISGSFAAVQLGLCRLQLGSQCEEALCDRGQANHYAREAGVGWRADVTPHLGVVVHLQQSLYFQTVVC